MPHKLLLADDSVTIQRVIELTFADEDVSLTAVGDGRQAIERIEADPPDIVLADVGMPEKDGYEVAAFVKNNPRTAHIPVLLLTGAFEPVDEERARTVGCDGVLAKPFEPQMVITRVKELLAEASRPVPPLRQPPQAPPPAVTASSPDAAAAPELQIETVQMSTTEMLAELDALTLPMPPRPGPAADPAPEPPLPADEPLAIESALDAAVRIRRRQTMTVPEFGVPPAELPDEPPVPAPASAPPAGQQAALDDYFERLDAAFSTLGQAAPEPVPAAWEPPAALAPTAEAAFESPAAAPAPLTYPTDPLPVPAGEARAPVFADAFSALLAAERGEGDLAPVLPVLAPNPYAAPAAVDVDALADRVTRQVLEHLTDRVVREAVTDIVSKVAERLVREEIDRLKASLR